MASMSPLTWIIIGGIALLLFGPKNLPKIAKSAGETIRELKSHASSVEQEVRKSLEDPAPTSSETPKSI
jgi:sec-independent protein translocase protein TatA